MRIAILGDGQEERLWVEALTRVPGAKLVLVCPRWADRPEVLGVEDVNSALAAPGIDWFILAGEESARAETLRRAAAEGVRVIVRHPPSDSVDAYYQVALTPQETGAVIVPDLGMRFHPGLSIFHKALQSGEFGEVLKIRLEAVTAESRGGLVTPVCARVLDLLLALGGDVAAVTAAGDPVAEGSVEGLRNLNVQLRFASGIRGEMELRRGSMESAQLILQGSAGSLVLEFRLDEEAPARLIRKQGTGAEQMIEIEAWSPRVGLLRAIEEAQAARRPIEPGLSEGTRASEIAEAVARSLRRNRTIEMHGTTATELGNFKAVMAASGCGLVLILLLLLPLALMGPALGVRWTVYLAWLIPPLLVVFVLAQLLRLGIKERPGGDISSTADEGQTNQ